MKNLLKQSEDYTSLFKFDLKMRISVLLLLTSMFALQANEGYSQRTKVTLNLENITVERLIDEIEDKTEFRFLYLLEDVNLKRIVSIKAKREKVNSILDRIFSNTETVYQIDDRQISLVKRGEPEITISELPQISLRGTVSDEYGAPLPGVSVIIKGTSTGVVSDFDGNYAIQVQSGQTLLFSYLGMKDKEVVVGNSTVIDVVMEEDVASLQEVVVEGYRTVAKEKSVISSVQLSSESLEARPNASFVQSLSGQVAGLDIQTGSGQPGANSLVQIRGVSSINGNTEPLFLMDGVPIDEDNFRSLNPNDIESISVIKDAAGSSIFGSRGANGVIVIKTKKGRKNSPLAVTYTGTQSFTSLQDHGYELMSAPEYLRFERDVLGRGRGVGMTDAEIDATPTTDWEKLFFRTGIAQNHTLTFAQGGENSSSFTSLGYFNQEGTLRNTNLKRFTFRNNLSGSSANGKFNYNTNITANYSQSGLFDSPGGSGVFTNLIYGANASLPYLSPDEYVDGATLANQSFSLALTPFYLIDRLATFENNDEEVKMIAGFSADYEFVENLTAKINLGVDYTNTIQSQLTPPHSLFALWFAEDDNLTPGTHFQDTDRVFSFNNNLSLNYNNVFGKHTVDATFFTEYFKAHARYFSAFARGINPRNFALGDDAAFVGDVDSNDYFVDDVGATKLDAGLFSYFGNLDYDYDSRYGVSATLRRDASYRFSTTNRWGTFYSVGARWNVSNESFMENSVFDELKLRASYGTTGNQRINGNDYFSAPDRAFSFYGTSQGYGNANSIVLTQLGNNVLRWEEVTQANIGADFQVFNSRLRGSLDVYHKRTDGLFQGEFISYINGRGVLDSNVGSMINKGVDWVFHYDLVKNDNLTFTLNFVGNFNDNELVDLPSETGEILGVGRNGGKLGETKLIRYAGVNPGNGNVLFLDADGNLTENPDPDTDAVWTGKNITPDATGSFGFDLNYKGFYLDTQWSFVVGVDRQDLVHYELLNNGFALTQFNLSREMLNAWTPENRVTDIPAIGATNATAFRLQNDRFYYDSDYLRLRFLNVGYVFPSKFLKNTGLTNLKIFGSAENLFTFSKWRGYDAESRDTAFRQYPTPRIFSVGVEIGI